MEKLRKFFGNLFPDAFLWGLGKSFDIANQLSSPFELRDITDYQYPLTDSEAISLDWHVVGNDMRNAINRHEH